MSEDSSRISWSLKAKQHVRGEAEKGRAKNEALTWVWADEQPATWRILYWDASMARELKDACGSQVHVNLGRTSVIWKVAIRAEQSRSSPRFGWSPTRLSRRPTEWRRRDRWKQTTKWKKVCQKSAGGNRKIERQLTGDVPSCQAPHQMFWKPKPNI